MFRNHLTTILRHLRKQRFFSLLNIAGLALGLAGSLLILLYVYHELSYDRQHEQAGRIYRVTRAYDYPSGYNHHFARVPEQWINELPAAFPEIERLLRLQPHQSAHLILGEQKFREEAGFAADPYIFDVFTLPLRAGDPATALASPHAIVLSAGVARRYFGEADPMGQPIELAGSSLETTRRYTVTGILEELPGSSHIDIHFLTSFPNAAARSGWAYVYLLLEAGADPNRLAAKFPAFIDRHIDEENASQHNRLQLQALTDIHLDSHLARELQPNGNRAGVYLFALIALFILLLACINFTNLSIALGAGRFRELSLRKVLGSSRRQLIAYLLGEALVISLLAFLLALAIIHYVQPLFQALTGAELYLWNAGILSVFLAVALLAGLLAGLYPALTLAAVSPLAILSGRLALPLGSRRVSLRKVLVVLQFAVSIALLIGTGVTYRQFEYLRNKQLGFTTAQIVALPDLPGAAKANYTTLRQEMEALPGVQGVSAAMTEPSANIRDTGHVFAEGKTEDADELVMDILPVDSNFLTLMDIDLAAGASFRPPAVGAINFPDEPAELFEAVNGAERTYLLNEAAVAAVGWPSPEAAIGQLFSWSNEVIDLQRGPIVGVVKDFHFSSLRNAVRPLVLIYEPRFFGSILVKVDPQRLEATLTGLQDVWDKQLPEYAFQYAFLDKLFARLYVSEQRQARLLGVFSAIAVFIASLGILGLTALAARQRRREIGIRKVIGASTSQILDLLTSELLSLVLLANLIAWPLAYAFMRRWLQHFAYHTEIRPAIFLLAGGGALFIAVLSVSWSAIQAARADPAEVIRNE